MRRFVLTALILVPFGLALLAGCGGGGKTVEVPTGTKAPPPPTQQKGTGVEK